MRVVLPHLNARDARCRLIQINSRRVSGMALRQRARRQRQLVEATRRTGAG